ncbi:hypothetical protein QLQ12_33590 [Actinoplanes sp. NEAU-A12]|uniref:WXG100 family type VII secretion target n=1 Tax=Actinoplanes sandaracinus TaxID=3045177 RepID=A0ABT6WUY3_9ACTN|nr:hypothetical protein [Actinoplanes sandaracinus]MDI6103556.1 hypothetical protein [Actinoplanes sandaracinus]
MTFPVSGPISAREFQQALGDIHAGLDSVNSSVAKIFEHSNRALFLLPAGLGDGLRSALEELGRQITELGEIIVKFLANPGDPLKLFATAGEWTTKVGGPISAMSGQISSEQLRIDNFWTGPAADAYAATLPAQQKAIEAIEAAADTLDANLTKVAGGIVAFWVGLAIPFASYVSELVVEAAAAQTGVGAPPAAAAAGASTAKFIALVSAVILAFSTYTALVFDSLSALRQALYSNAPFPGGGWPRSNPSDFNDGSLADGDTTGWRMNVD